MKIRELLLFLRKRIVALRLAVNRCIACGKLICSNEMLCEECRAKYNEERAWECGSCGKRLSECNCVPHHLEAASVQRLLKLLRYRVDMPNAVGNRIIYRLKKVPLLRMHQFFAEELTSSVSRLFLNDDCLITHVPRTVRQRKKYGFDQSECIARALSERSGIPVLTLLERKRTNEVQKRLSGISARAANVKDAFYPADTNFSLRGKRVLLIDDIVTTGASMAECARVLRRMGAREVIGVALAVSYRHPNLKYEHDANTREERFNRKR